MLSKFTNDELAEILLNATPKKYDVKHFSDLAEEYVIACDTKGCNADDFGFVGIEQDRDYRETILVVTMTGRKVVFADIDGTPRRIYILYRGQCRNCNTEYSFVSQAFPYARTNRFD